LRHGILNHSHYDRAAIVLECLIYPLRGLEQRQEISWRSRLVQDTDDELQRQAAELVKRHGGRCASNLSHETQSYSPFGFVKFSEPESGQRTSVHQDAEVAARHSSQHDVAPSTIT
jgi:hypothetical protein